MFSDSSAVYDNPYCAPPAIGQMLDPIGNVWTSVYPLIRITITWVNQTTSPSSLLDSSTSSQAVPTSPYDGSGSPSIESRASPVMSPQMLTHSIVAKWTSARDVPDEGDVVPVISFINARFCSYGYTFVLEAVTGYLLAIFSFACLIALLWYTRQHIHRKLLFLLLFGVGMVRGIFGHLGANHVGQLQFWFEAVNMMPWFFEYTIPLNLLSDILIAYVDFLLTFFWLRFVAPRWSSSHWGTVVPVVSCVVSALIGLIAFLMDYHEIYSLGNYSNGQIYARSLSYISALLLFSAVLHAVVVIRLLWDILRQQATHLVDVSPRLRSHIVAVGVIGLVSVLAGTLRGIVLIGHVSKESVFFNGLISFDNPAFTTTYLILFMNVPALVVACAFFALSWSLMRSTSITSFMEQRGGGRGTDDDRSSGGGGAAGVDGVRTDDAAVSVSSDGEGVRVAFLHDYRRRAHASFPRPTVLMPTEQGVNVRDSRVNTSVNASVCATDGSDSVVRGIHSSSSSSTTPYAPLLSHSTTTESGARDARLPAPLNHPMLREISNVSEGVEARREGGAPNSALGRSATTVVPSGYGGTSAAAAALVSTSAVFAASPPSLRSAGFSKPPKQSPSAAT